LSLSARHRSGTDEPNLSIAFGEGYDKRSAHTRGAEDQESRLADRVIGIVNRGRMIVREHFDCLFEGHAMFSLIGRGLSGVPLEVHDRVS
jgi:hypothetical protein